MSILAILFLAFVQNVSFTMVSRSRNRDNMVYHSICSVFSNSLWFLTMHLLVITDLSWVLFIPYVTGTVIGSLTGAKISMYIEKKIGAKT